MTTDDKKPIIKQEGAPPVQQQQKRYRKRGNRHFYRKANNTQNTKLKGKTEELDGFVYDVGSMSQAQIFVDTTREIAEYTGRTLKEAQDIRMAIEDLEEITLNRPTKNRTGDDEENTAIFKIELDSYFKRLNAYRQNKATMYSIVLGQCTDAMRAKLEGDKRFNNIKVKSDVIELLKLIRSIAYDVEADSYPFMAQHAALKNYITHFQKFNTPNDVYLDNYNNLKEVLTHCGVTLGSNKILQDYTLKSKGLDPNIRYQNILSAAKKATEEAYDAIVFISGLNSHRYQGLIDSLANAYLNGRDEYPKNIVDAYKLINNWKGDQKNFSNRTEDEASFNQIGDGNVDANVNATTGRLKCRDGTDVKCVICGENHYPSNCPKRGTNQKEDAAPEETKHNNASTTNVTIKEEVTATQHTIRGNLEANWSDWEDNTDYKALMFLTNGVPNNAEIVKHIDNGSSFDEITKCMTYRPSELDHVIVVKDEDDDETIIIPLKLRGVTSYFNSRRPSKAEYEDDSIRKIDLTVYSPEWEPHTDEYAQLEINYFDCFDCFREIGDDGRRVYGTSVSDKISHQNAKQTAERTSQSAAVLTEIDSNLIEIEFARRLQDNWLLSSNDIRRIAATRVKTENESSATSFSTRKQGIQPEDLVKRWKCGLENAKQTLKVTTQRGVRTIANPALSRRFRTNDRQLRYRRVRADVFTDTLTAKTISFRKNKYAQAYGTSFKWARCYGM